MSAFNTEEPLGKWEWSELLVSHVTLRTELLVTTGWQAPSYLCLWNGMSVNFLGIECDPSSFPTLNSPAYDRWWWRGGILFPFVVPPREGNRKWRIAFMEYLQSPVPEEGLHTQPGKLYFLLFTEERTDVQEHWAICPRALSQKL